MAFTLKEVVLWGRSFDEYVKMVALTDDDFKSSILGCSDGPASFNAVLSRKGGNVVSIDPIYQLTEDAIKNRISETYDHIIEQTEKIEMSFFGTLSLQLKNLAKSVWQQ